MPDSIGEFFHVEGIYCLGRALILVILVGSEVMLARRRSRDFEPHLILLSASVLLLLAEVYAVVISWFAHGQEAALPGGVWVWYPILGTLGLMGLAFRFDFAMATEDDELRANCRFYLITGGVLATLGVLLTGMDFHPAAHVSSFEQLGFVSVLLHGAQVATLVLIGWKVMNATGKWLSVVESRVFLAGCGVGLVGAVAQVFRGPDEPFTTAALMLFVSVILREHYRSSEMAAARLAEDRSSKMLLFHRITTQLKSSFELAHLYEILIDRLMSIFAAESGAIFLRKGLEGDLRPEYVQGPFPPPKPLPEWCPDDLKVIGGVVSQMRIKPGDVVIGKVAESGRPLYVYRAADAARHYTWATGLFKVQTTIALPLRSPEGIYGVVQVVNRTNGGMFLEEDIRFMSLLVEQAGVAIYNARLYAERLERQRSHEQMKIARDIQLRLIPRTLPKIPGLAIGAEYNAAQEVGGDYYDIYRIDHDHVGLIVFDVAGKGVPGALMMAITATFLKMAAPQAQSPAWVLNEVNAALGTEMHRGLYVTAVYGVLQLSTLKLTLCSAGHPDALIVTEDGKECRHVKPQGAALGLLRPNRFRAVMEMEEVQLHPGDTVVLYTDGVLEARNSEGEEFGEQRLGDTARENAGREAREIAEAIGSAARRFAGEEPQYDDTTVLAVKVAPQAAGAGRDES